MDADGFVLRGSDSWVVHYDTNGNSAGKFLPLRASVIHVNETTAHLTEIAKFKANLRHHSIHSHKMTKCLSN